MSRSMSGYASGSSRAPSTTSGRPPSYDGKLVIFIRINTGTCFIFFLIQNSYSTLGEFLVTQKHSFTTSHVM